jgi:hypothetical protein
VVEEILAFREAQSVLNPEVLLAWSARNRYAEPVEREIPVLAATRFRPCTRDEFSRRNYRYGRRVKLDALNRKGGVSISVFRPRGSLHESRSAAPEWKARGTGLNK